MKKLLVITPWYLPGTSAGGPVRSLSGLCELLKDECEIYIFTPAKDVITGIKYQGVILNEWTNYKKNIRLFYHDHTFKFKNLTEIIHLVKPNAVYFNNFWSLKYTWYPVRIISIRFPDLRLVLATRGMLDENSMRIKSLKKKAFLCFLKLTGWFKKVTFHATNTIEQQNIKKHLSNSVVKVVPNVNFIIPVIKEIKKNKGQLKMFFLSRISPIKKADYALEILKGVPENIKIEYDLYGNEEDMAYVEKCKIIASQMPGHIKVSFKGSVPLEKTAEIIADYHLLFLPSANENFGHAIVESMLCARPVLISDQTPWIGLEIFKAGMEFPLSQKDKFLKAIIQFAEMELYEWRMWCKGAQDFIHRAIDREKTKRDYLNLFFDEIKN
ncbi:MAG: glycosyltransferase [Bacteroidia bacterium]|nr:glycosyltransferase [Bacteroidia bacterium]